MKDILVTGTAGFIGFHLSKRLLETGYRVIGVDNLHPYYSVDLKKARLLELQKYSQFHFLQEDIVELENWKEKLSSYSIKKIIHLAAQPGVRYSLENPHIYIQTNVQGFLNILELAKELQIEHLIYASSSSVYGLNKNIPFSPHDPVDHPQSLYGATKRANELMAHSYSYIYRIPTTGLRFFTVYGPWGRPDMAYFKFAKAIYEGREIPVYGEGRLKRDFTFIDDVIEGILKLLDHSPKPKKEEKGKLLSPCESMVPFQIFNMGNHKPEEVLTLIQHLEFHLGKKAKIRFLPKPSVDVNETYADIEDIQKKIGFSPSTNLEKGISIVVRWFLDWVKRNPKI
ncbi:MAG: NAD-dependent epimerase/dehydratase family protein [Planctomycetota bacterium]|nr:MAG: NAD-dependent epimerase/dehydratase family protein [Planctomycetota bacterium]